MATNNFTSVNPTGIQDYVEISKTRVKRLRAQARAIVKKIDKVYSNNTTVLRKVGQFNNGEAIYESA